MVGTPTPPLSGQALIDYENATNARVYAQEQVYAQTPGTAAYVALRTPGTYEFNIVHGLTGNTTVDVAQSIFGNKPVDPNFTPVSQSRQPANISMTTPNQTIIQPVGVGLSDISKINPLWFVVGGIGLLLLISSR